MWVGVIVGVVYLLTQYGRVGTPAAPSSSPTAMPVTEGAVGPTTETLPVLLDPSSPPPGSSVVVELVEPPAQKYAAASMTESDLAYQAVVRGLDRRDVVYDANLGAAARELAVQHSLLGGLVPQHIVDFLLRSAGAIDRSVVQAYTATAGDGMDAVEERIGSLLSSHTEKNPVTRVGIGEAYIPGAKRSRHIAILLSFREVEISPALRSVPVGARWTLTGVLPPNFEDASALIHRPNGVLETVPLTTEGRRFALSVEAGDEEGTLQVSVGGEGPHGHTPLLQVPVAVGRGVPRVLVSALLPDETDISESDEAEDLAMDVLNVDRKRYGLSLLLRDTRLDQVARRHSVDMRDHSFFGHYSVESGTPADRLSSAAYRTAHSAENVAKGGSIHGAQSGLMHSLGHRRNILNKHFTHVGIGVAGQRQGEKTLWWLTQVFAVPVERVTSTDGRESVLKRIRTLRARAGQEPLERDDALDNVARQGVLELAAGGGQGVPDRLIADASKRFPRLGRLFVWAASTSNMETLVLPSQLFASATRRLGIAVYQYPDHPHGLIGVVLVTLGDGGGE
jgi:uncharacterized protein YkwD